MRAPRAVGRGRVPRRAALGAADCSVRDATLLRAVVPPRGAVRRVGRVAAARWRARQRRRARRRRASAAGPRRCASSAAARDRPRSSRPPAAVLSCAGPLGELESGAPVWLPPRRPRALALEIHDADGELERLQRACWPAAAVRDGQPERRRLRPARHRRAHGGAAPAGAPPEHMPRTPQLGFTPRCCCSLASCEPSGPATRRSWSARLTRPRRGPSCMPLREVWLPRAASAGARGCRRARRPGAAVPAVRRRCRAVFEALASAPPRPLRRRDPGESVHSPCAARRSNTARRARRDSRAVMLGGDADGHVGAAQR